MFTALPSAEACGPNFPGIPKPKFFTSKIDGNSVSLLERSENLQLWQQLTSTEIPASDIAQVLYEQDDYDPESAPGNLFYVYLRNTKDREIEEFLLTAKSLERERKARVSPWYYPASRYSTTDDFFDIIGRCKAYRGSRLKDRYALQLVRALFAAQDYAGCVDSYNECFRGFPDSNLMKRMAMRYVAGCWSRMGDTDKANNYFAQAGDFYSIVHSDAVAYMAAYNPDCPELMAHIQHCSADSASFCAIREVAQRVLRGSKVRYRGDWEFYLAYEAGEFHSDYAAASRHIARAMQSRFSSTDFRDHARAYRMKIDAALGRSASLLSDLRWMEGKMNILSDDALEWNRMLRNIIYVNWIPSLWQKMDYATAILLCGYADNLFAGKQLHAFNPFDYTWSLLGPSVTLEEMRNSRICENTIDYCNVSFRLMNSLTSSQLMAVKHAIAADSPLYRHLKRHARTDAPYLDEIIGTLALREERYSRAADYLARVPQEYLSTLNIYKAGHLQANPFCVSPGCWHDFDSIAPSPRAKYHFACRMQHYQRLMRYGTTPDERGIARLKYAIGRRNSFEACWALTQYWRGCVPSLFMPLYGEVDILFSSFPKLYDYDTTVDAEATQAVFDREVKAALAMLTTDTARAEAEYLLSHLKTIVIRYPATPTARAVKQSCDRWHHWL